MRLNRRRGFPDVTFVPALEGARMVCARATPGTGRGFSERSTWDLPMDCDRLWFTDGAADWRTADVWTVLVGAPASICWNRGSWSTLSRNESAAWGRTTDSGCGGWKVVDGSVGPGRAGYPTTVPARVGG
jgi:hypothetical protein